MRVLKPLNNTIKITIESPLLRPGIKIETETSEGHAYAVLCRMMKIVEIFNAKEKDDAKEE